MFRVPRPSACTCRDQLIPADRVAAQSSAETKTGPKPGTSRCAVARTSAEKQCKYGGSPFRHDTTEKSDLQHHREHRRNHCKHPVDAAYICLPHPGARGLPPPPRPLPVSLAPPAAPRAPPGAPRARRPPRAARRAPRTPRGRTSTGSLAARAQGVPEGAAPITEGAHRDKGTWERD